MIHPDQIAQGVITGSCVLLFGRIVARKPVQTMSRIEDHLNTSTPGGLSDIVNKESAQ